MNALFEAAREIQDLCEQYGWGFCFIGGLAVLRWGEPRLTRDVDLTILTGYGSEAAVIDGLLDRFESRVDEPEEFALRNRVALLRATNAVPVDVALGALEFEARTVQRSSPWDAGDVVLRTCSAEDLLVHKVFAGRAQDWLDVEGIVVRQGGKLDRELVLEELTPLLEAKHSPEQADRLQELFDR